jgi:hypothetical protein
MCDAGAAVGSNQLTAAPAKIKPAPHTKFRTLPAEYSVVESRQFLDSLDAWQRYSPA